MESTEWVIRADGLTKRHRGALALDNLCLKVSRGSIYALVGTSGAGKTTTIKLLVNILEASSGVCEVLGVDSRRLGPRQFQQIGYVSENQELPKWMTVEYYLDFLSPFYPTWDSTLAARLLREFDLPRKRRIGQLSRGMTMKVALASSLAYRPALMILDEPFTGLDVLVRDQLTEGLRMVENTTILISSHDLIEIEPLVSHIGFLESGRLRFSEELGALTARFREVVLTFEGPAQPLDPWPSQWLQPICAGGTLRFVHSEYRPAATIADLRRQFPSVSSIETKELSLRSIFVALARSGPRQNNGDGRRGPSQ